MIDLPFFLDVSKRARLIRRIKADGSDISTLRALSQMLVTDTDKVSTSQLQAIWDRSEKALAASSNAEQSEVLDTLLRQARWSVQSRDMRYRYF